MNTFRNDLLGLVSRHIARAPTDRLLAMVDALNGESTVTASSSDRFAKIGANGQRVAESASDWVAVHDARTNLTWTRQVLDCGRKPWKDAMKAAKAVHLFDRTDWRAPTIQEQLSIIDYERCEPALDTAFFDGEYGWTWTSTVAKSPSGYASYVYLYDGGSDRYGQDCEGFCRAVCAGQPLELGL